MTASAPRMPSASTNQEVTRVSATKDSPGTASTAEVTCETAFQILYCYYEHELYTHIKITSKTD